MKKKIEKKLEIFFFFENFYGKFFLEFFFIGVIKYENFT